MMLLAGPTGPIAVHPPTACYRGLGYTLAAEPATMSVPRNQANSNRAASRDRFQVAEFIPPPHSMSPRVRVAWAWSNDGRWSAPEHPRVAFAGRPALFKLYVTTDASSTHDDAESTIDRFLEQALPELRNRLFADGVAP